MLLLKLCGMGFLAPPGAELSAHCRSGNSHFLLLLARTVGSVRTPDTGVRRRHEGCAAACLRNVGQHWLPKGLPRDGCVSPGQKDKQAAQLSPRSSHDVSGSGSRSVCRSDMTQPVSAWQPAEPAGRGQEVVSYLLRLNVEKVLTGPQINGKACSQRLAGGHKCGHGLICLVLEDSIVFCTPRSSCAMHTIQKCKQGWPLPHLHCY